MNKNTTIGLLILSTMGLIASIILGTQTDVSLEITISFIVINTIGVIIGFYKLDDLESKEPITIEKLREFKSFGQEQDGSFCDRWEFSIYPIKDVNDKIIKFSFCMFDEVDGATTRVRYITTMKQLHDLYRAITDKELN